MAHRPGGVLLAASAAANALFTLMSIAVIASGTSPLRYLPLVVAGLLWIFIGAFTYFRDFLRRNVDDIALQASSSTVVIDGNVVSHDAEVARTDGSSSELRSSLHDEAEALGEAYRETTFRTAKYFPRIEAAQRGLIRAAGGVVNAPYLKHDLRLVVGSFLGTALALPIALTGFMVCALALLIS